MELVKLENLETLRQYVDILSESVEEIGTECTKTVEKRAKHERPKRENKTVWFECCLCEKKFHAENALHTHIRRMHKIGLMHYDKYKADIETGASIECLGLPENVKASIRAVQGKVCKRKIKHEEDEGEAVPCKKKRGGPQKGTRSKLPAKQNTPLPHVDCALCGYPFQRLRDGLQHMEKKHAADAGYVNAVQELEYGFSRRRVKADHVVEIACPLCQRSCVGELPGISVILHSSQGCYFAGFSP